MNLVGKYVPLDEKRKLEKNGVEVAVWKGVGTGMRGIWEYGGGNPGCMAISAAIMGNFRKYSNSGDTRGTQHDIAQLTVNQNFDVRSGPK